MNISEIRKYKNHVLMAFIFGIPFLVEMYIEFFFHQPPAFQYVIDAFNNWRFWSRIIELIAIYLILCLSYFLSSYKKSVIAVWAFFIYIPEALNVVSTYVTGFSLYSGFVGTILTANLQEIIFTSFDYFFFILINIVVIFTAFRISKKITFTDKKYGKYFLGIFIIAVCGSHFQPLQAIGGAFSDYFNDLKELENYDDQPFKNIKSDFPTQKQTYVLVIGESVDKKHMQIYGYDRETTPCFKKIENELFVFKNVRTAHVLTNDAVKSMLQLIDKNGKKSTIIHFFKNAGFKTFWFSNQGQNHFFDNVLKRIGMLCDQSVFINRTDFRNMVHQKYFDEELLKYFQNALRDPANKKLIILHLSGSHFPLDLRYPKKFKKFSVSEGYRDKKKAKVVCEYDNSILYTDYVLNETISILKAEGGISCLLYLSDHGQDIYDRKDCELTSRKTIHAYEIPFVVWVSEDYRKANLDFINLWNLNVNFMTDKTAYSIIDLARLRCDCLDLSDSIFRGSF